MLTFWEDAKTILAHLELKARAFWLLLKKRYPSVARFALEQVAVAIISVISAVIVGGGNLDTAFLLRTGIVFVVLWSTLNVVWVWVKTPAYVFFGEKKRADRYGYEEIGLDFYNPKPGSVHREGLAIINNKDVPIEQCRLSLNGWIIDGILYPPNNFPFDLAWMVGRELVWDNITVEGNGGVGYVAIRTWPPPFMHDVYESKIGNVDLGQSTGIECGGRLGLAIYENLTYRLDVELNFVVQGTRVTMPSQLDVNFEGGTMYIIPTDALE